jgi:ribosomal protein S18 acetylase RimI-like enzyme
MTDIRIVSDPHASESLKQFVTDQLDMYNVAATGFREYSPVNFFLRDTGDEVVGGLLGGIWGGVLFIRILWVSEALRGQGFGRRLLDMAERRGMERGCRHVFLDTFDFQAPGFYERLGYRTYAKAEDWPVGHAHHFLRKDLPTPS